MSLADELLAMLDQIARKAAAIEPRGYDSIQARNDLYAQWDDPYEDYLLERAVEETDTHSAAATEPTP